MHSIGDRFASLALLRSGWVCAFAAWAVLCLAGACTSATTALNPEGRVGEACPVCPDECSQTDHFASNCDCEGCLSFGFNADAGLLLDCIGGKWQRRRECPGGVSVACTASNAYDISCLDAEGNEIPLNR